MLLRAPSTDARISKAKKMREEENKKQHRERLRDDQLVERACRRGIKSEHSRSAREKQSAGARRRSSEEEQQAGSEPA